MANAFGVFFDDVQAGRTQAVRTALRANEEWATALLAGRRKELGFCFITALGLAARCAHREIVEALLPLSQVRQVKDVQNTHARSCLPLTQAALGGDEQCFDLILQATPSKYRFHDLRDTLRILGMQGQTQGLSRLMKALEDSEADSSPERIGAVDREHPQRLITKMESVLSLSLLAAVKAGHLDFAKNVAASGGLARLCEAELLRTPLMIAASAGQLDVLNWLLPLSDPLQWIDSATTP